MGIIESLPSIIKQARSNYESTSPASILQSWQTGCGANILARSDNLPFIKHLLKKDMSGSIQMIYLDPPFLSNAVYQATIKVDDLSIKYRAYDDNWSDDEPGYYRMLAESLYGMKDLLRDDGLLWMHLDWHTVHYVKVMMDEIFGKENFVNEIIWQYKSGGSAKNHFARKHDTLLLYGKTKDHFIEIPKEKSYNRELKPYRFKNVQEHQDGVGWYTLVNMKDVWNIDMVGRTSSERNGYATQKPERLLKTIVNTSTRPGDICADFFAGSSTMAVVAAKSGRRFISCDSERLATAISRDRLCDEGIDFDFLITEQSESAGDPGHGITIDIDFEESDGGFDITLNSLTPSMDDLALDEEDKRKVIQKINSDPLCLVKSWSIDIDYNCKTHHSHAYFLRKKNKIKNRYHGSSHGRMISVIVTDVFGREASWTSGSIK